MNRLEAHLNYLLSRNDCVIIPGLGALITMDSCAQIDLKSGILTPPCRKVTFNSSITHNDGLLATSFSRESGDSYEDSCKKLENEVTELCSNLDKHGVVNICGIGRLIKQADSREPEFVSNDNGSANTLYFGLTDLNLNHRSGIENESDDNETAETKFHSLTQYLLRAAASVAIIVCVIAGVINSLQISDSGITIASLIPAGKSSPDVIEKEVAVSNFANQELTIRLVNSEEGTATYEASRLNKELSSADSKYYYLVVASLANEEETERYLAQAPKLNMEYGILRNGGRIRIYIAKATTYEAAHSVRNIDNNSHYFPDAWVYTK